MEEMEN
jgi:hypothetical protein